MAQKTVAATERSEAIHKAEEHENNRTALLIAIFAMFLAISSMHSSGTGRELLDANVHSSRSTSLYETKDLRQTVNELAVDQYEVLLTMNRKDLTPADKALIETHIRKAQDNIRALEGASTSSPSHLESASITSSSHEEEAQEDGAGKSKKDLAGEAKMWEEKRNHAEAQLPSFEFADALFEITIVLLSASVILKSVKTQYFAVGLGVIAIVLMLNGFFTWFHLPFG
ncbi:MAG TPA: DUF4337 family protein [Chthonomonadaceae bacterium]|nr:DUF4337 family protein [Chthonomonadaceae bacterium]